MKHLLLIALVVLVGAAFVAWMGSVAHAQSLIPAPVDLPICQKLEAVDLNGDGKLDDRDFELWILTLHERTGEECRLGGPASGCPAFMDVNGDSIITYDDLVVMEHYLLFCVNPAWSIVGPRG